MKAKAAIEGCKYGQVNLGSAYELGRGVEKNEIEAFNWFLKVTNNENYDLSHEFGIIGTTIDRLKALEWYQKSADNGNSLAFISFSRNTRKISLSKKKMSHCRDEHDHSQDGHGHGHHDHEHDHDGPERGAEESLY
ncbi:unnamed protein product [Rhizophagus irregularis]|nr:unnamed protein product [Rhizophagus irregularis]